MNLTDFHHTCMAGGKIYNSSRILHALLKKSFKTGGCLLKNSDQDHRIRGAVTSSAGWLHETTVEDFEFVLRINLTGSFLVAKHTLPLMMERGGGAIVTTASIAVLVVGSAVRR